MLSINPGNWPRKSTRRSTSTTWPGTCVAGRASTIQRACRISRKREQTCFSPARTHLTQNARLLMQQLLKNRVVTYMDDQKLVIEQAGRSWQVSTIDLLKAAYTHQSATDTPAANFQLEIPGGGGPALLLVQQPARLHERSRHVLRENNFLGAASRYVMPVRQPVTPAKADNQKIAACAGVRFRTKTRWERASLP